MNDNKLSTNLSTIDTAVSRMRTSLGATNLDINRLADKVAEVKASLDGLESDMVYEVASRAAMTALNGVQDGSACLIKGTETRGIKKWDKFITINFPDRIVLNTPLAEDEVINIGIKIKGTGHGTLTGSLTATSFIFGVIIKGQGASAKSITYTAQGNTYVRTDSYGSPIIAAGELQWDDNYAFDDRLSQFFVADILLEETNIYYKNSWVPVNAGETLELKMTTAEQAATILEQTATNNRLNTDLAAANVTIQQQGLTITAQENTITLKDAEIAALNARIEELENENSPAVTSYSLNEPMATYNASLEAGQVYALKGWSTDTLDSISSVTSIHSYGAPLMQIQEGYKDFLGDLEPSNNELLKYGFKSSALNGMIQIYNHDTGAFEDITTDIIIYTLDTSMAIFSTAAPSQYMDAERNVFFKALVNMGIDHFSPEIPSFVLENNINMLYTTQQ